MQHVYNKRFYSAVGFIFVFSEDGVTKISVYFYNTSIGVIDSTW